MACARPMVVVLLPSPRGVGVMLQTKNAVNMYAQSPQRQNIVFSLTNSFISVTLSGVFFVVVFLVGWLIFFTFAKI